MNRCRQCRGGIIAAHRPLGHSRVVRAYGASCPMSPPPPQTHTALNPEITSQLQSTMLISLLHTALYKWIIFIHCFHFKDFILRDIDQRLDKLWGSPAGQRNGTGCSWLDSWSKCQGLGFDSAVYSDFLRGKLQCVCVIVNQYFGDQLCCVSSLLEHKTAWEIIAELYVVFTTVFGLDF